MITVKNISEYSFVNNTLANDLEIGCTVAELRELLRYMHVAIPGKPRKNTIVKLTCDYLLKHVDLIFDFFPQYDLHLLKELVDAGEHGIVTKRFNLIYPIVAEYSLVTYCYKKGEEIIRYFIPDDLRLALKEGFESYHPTDEKIRVKKIMQTAEGLVNLYGLVSLLDLLKQLRRLYPNADYMEITEAVGNSVMLNFNSFMCDEESYYRSPYYIWQDDCKVIEDNRPNYIDIDFKQFSIETADMAGSASFHGYENNLERKLMEALTSEVHFSRDNAEGIIELLWRNVNQSGELPTSAKQYLSYYIDVEKYKEIVNLAQQYVDSVPLWHMKGHTSQEVDNIRSREFMNELISKFNKIIDNTNSEKTVGRNDPCPCGSGKKYKKCCGK